MYKEGVGGQKVMRQTLKGKRVPKQCPWGIHLENGAFFNKKDTSLVSLGHQNKVVPPDTRAALSKKVPKGHRHRFSQNGALSTKRAPK